MNDCTNQVDWSPLVPIFPLPNLSLLPRAIVPLHLFEPRYRDMAREALASSRLIAMAYLKPGYQEKYYTHVASIHPVLCLGQILRHEKLADGRYNILLQGVCRASVLEHDRQRSYRRGRLRAVPIEDDLDESQAEALRHRLSGELARDPLGLGSTARVLLNVVHCPTLSVSDMLDLLAFNLLGTADERHEFLEQPGVARRAERLIQFLCAGHSSAEGSAPLRRCAGFISYN